MALPNVVLKRYNGTTYDELYPKTSIAQVDGLTTALSNKIETSTKGQANGVASLDGDAKLPVSQLPDVVFNGLEFWSVISAAGSVSTYIAEVVENAYALTGGDGNISVAEGKYFVAGATGTYTGGTFTSVTGDYYNVQFRNESGTLVNSIALEMNDSIIIESASGLGVSGFPYVIHMAVTHNTNETATTSAYGLTRLSDGNGGVTTGMSGNDVITEGNLAGLIGTTSGKIAAGDHNHSALYQPLDTDLTAIAILTHTDGNFIVSNGTNWVVESGATARASLGLTIGTHVQAYDATLASISGLGTASNKMIYTTAVDTWAELATTPFGRGLLGLLDASAARNTIGVTIGADVQAFNENLQAIADLPVTDGNIMVGNGSTWVAESGATARASLGVYSTSEIDTKLSNRPEILYDSLTAVTTGTIVIDVI